MFNFSFNFSLSSVSIDRQISYNKDRSFVIYSRKNVSHRNLLLKIIVPFFMRKNIV